MSPLSFASVLDETLDREVFRLLQGPTPDQMSLEFKSLINKLVLYTVDTADIVPIIHYRYSSPDNSLDIFSPYCPNYALNTLCRDWYLTSTHFKSSVHGENNFLCIYDVIVL